MSSKLALILVPGTLIFHFFSSGDPIFQVLVQLRNGESEIREAHTHQKKRLSAPPPGAMLFLDSWVPAIPVSVSLQIIDYDQTQISQISIVWIKSLIFINIVNLGWILMISSTKALALGNDKIMWCAQIPNPIKGSSSSPGSEGAHIATSYLMLSSTSFPDGDKWLRILSILFLKLSWVWVFTISKKVCLQENTRIIVWFIYMYDILRLFNLLPHAWNHLRSKQTNPHTPKTFHSKS